MTDASDGIFGLISNGRAAIIWPGGPTVGATVSVWRLRVGGTIYSCGNNNISGNGTNVLPPEITLN